MRMRPCKGLPVVISGAEKVVLAPARDRFRECINNSRRMPATWAARSIVCSIGAIVGAYTHVSFLPLCSEIPRVIAVAGARANGNDRDLRDHLVLVARATFPHPGPRQST